MPAPNLKTSSHNWCSQRRSTNELLSSVSFLLLHHLSYVGSVHYCTTQYVRIGRHPKKKQSQIPFPLRNPPSPAHDQPSLSLPPPTALIPGSHEIPSDLAAAVGRFQTESGGGSQE